MIEIGLVQINNSFSGQNYLPYSVALLQAYVNGKSKDPHLYNFRLPIYKRQRIRSVVAELRGCAIVGFSTYVWNGRISLEIARRLEGCLVIFGGPHVPDDPTEFLLGNPQVDVVVHNEGEQTFLELLEAYPENDWSKIKGISYRRDGVVVRNPPRERFRDLDQVPSPFLTGAFDELMRQNPDEHWIGLWETNRGCPFQCSFCIAEGTLVPTKRGNTLIENVKVGDFVLGWDEEKCERSWNKVAANVCRDEQKVLRIATDAGSVEATSAHRFFTNRGWITAAEIERGDKVLSQMRASIQTTAQDKQVLQQQLLDDLITEKAFDTEGGNRRKIQSSTRGGVATHGSEKSDETERCRRQGEQSFERGTPQRDIYCVLGDPGGQRSYTRGGTQTDAGAEQSHQKSRNDEAYFCCGEKNTQWIRERDNCLSEVARFPVPIHGERNILGWPMQIWQKSEPGFCDAAEKIKEGDIGARNLLAQRPRENARGNRGLHEQRVADDHNLEYGQVECSDGEPYSGVCWATVKSVTQAGSKLVYDLVGLTPNPNFFADGFLAHNCDWGSNTATKVNKFGDDLLYREVDWFSRHKVEYLFCCDANFGIQKRDIEIAEYVAKVKRETGYPVAMSVQNTKNATERAYATQKILSDAGLNKGVALSMQSVDADTLVAIKRDNISLDTYMELQRRFARDGVETYSDLIIGLPGETYNSFVNGVDLLISLGQHNRIQFNNLSILPNAEMGSKEYQRKWGIETIESEIINIHGEKVALDDDVPEIQELVVSTASCSKEDWAKTRAFSWMAALLHFDKILQIPFILAHELGAISYRELVLAFMDARSPLLAEIAAFFMDEARRIQGGAAEYVYSPEYLGIYWPADEYMFIRLTVERKIDQFYDEACDLIRSLGEVPYLRDAIELNQALLKQPFHKHDVTLYMSADIMGFYESVRRGEKTDLAIRPTAVHVQRETFSWESINDWCREVVWWGNKKGAYLYGTESVSRQLAGHF